MSDFHTALQTHFKAHDPVLYPFVVASKPQLLTLQTNFGTFFSRLCQDIISQQLSIKVADVIIKRFEALLSTTVITPESVLAVEDEKLRQVGLSWAKIKYIKDLATKTLSHEVRFERLPNLNNREIIDELTKVKGIGQWTAEMFLIFTLGRENIFSWGDLGLKTAIIKLYKFDPSNKVKFKEQVLTVSEKWQPYKSYACLALWKSLEK